VYVDAGCFYGDGSYFVDGAAYPDVATPPDGSGHGGPDAAFDAAPGCGPLAACCGSLHGASQTLCTSVVAQGNATDCSAELTQLRATGDCTGVSVLATDVQYPPSWMVSDGTALFWTTSQGPGLVSMPVAGGAIRTLVTAVVQLIAVDATNVYVVESAGLIRLPKNGTPPSLVSDPGARDVVATTLGTAAYWSVVGDDGDGNAIESAPLLGGPVMRIAQSGGGFTDGPFAQVGVTSSTIFVGADGPPQYFPITGLPPSGLQTVTGPAVSGNASCISLTSDTDAVYCSASNGVNLRLASDGTATSFGQALDSSYIVFDDTYVYWADMTTVGTIMKAPKAGGGTATVIASDTSPTAIAVDASSVYWSDIAGYIKSVPK
jgi:hypothetical protein